MHFLVKNSAKKPKELNLCRPSSGHKLIFDDYLQYHMTLMWGGADVGRNWKKTLIVSLQATCVSSSHSQKFELDGLK